MDSETDITITIPAKQALHHHIEGLQNTLTKRNAEIERLTERLRELEEGEPNQAALAAAYKRGWRGATDQLMSVTADAARALGKVRKDAFSIYLQAERSDFGGHNEND